MAQISYRGNLSAKSFPLLSTNMGQSVIVGGPDQLGLSPNVQGVDDIHTDRGIPQIYYGHNVMPTEEGIQSVGFTRSTLSSSFGFKNIYTLRDTVGNRVLFSHKSDGSSWVLPVGAITWIQTTLILSTANSTTTVATINGQTYIYFSNIGCYIYDVGSNTLIPIVFTGLVATTILGIVAASGYMIAYTMDSIAWSSTVPRVLPTDPFDFVPSLVTGAGGGKIEAANSNITICKAHYLGVIIFTEDNAVAAIYSGNATYPFNFREIVGAGGLKDPAFIASEGILGAYYSFTNSGLQLVNLSAAQTVYPLFTDFLSGKVFEDFDTDALAFVTQILTSPMKKAVSVITDRYLVLSYGVTALTHALIYDFQYRRVGKVKINHVACFDLKYGNPEFFDVARQSFAFLQADGSIQIINFDTGSANRSGVIILGKYQYVRSRLLTLDEVSIENITSSHTFNLYNLVSLDGKNSVRYDTYQADSTAGHRVYNSRKTGINHSLLGVGTFNLVSIELKFHVGGNR